MLTRLVRAQLVIFAIAGIVGLTVMTVNYLQAPTLLGLGRITVTVELPRSGGLYRFSNVTYRGVQVGKVTDVSVHDGKRVEATLSLQGTARVPVDTTAAVRSMSAVGEQYIDLQPHDESGPYLTDGSTIPVEHTTVPQQVGPMLDQLGALVDSIPGDRLGDMLNESFKAFNGAGYDFGSLLDSAATLTHDLSGIGEQSRTLVADSRPLLDSQARASDSLRSLAHSIAGITDQVRVRDTQVRTILAQGPATADEVSRLLTQIKPTMPVLLANLITVGQVAVTYHPSLEQLLVLLPPAISTTQASSAKNNPTGLPLGDFELSVNDPPACNVGFLPPSQWRSPNDLSDIDTPDGLYCKLPQDSPISVRGARNYPCMGQPGKRAPTVQMCESDQPFMPLAMRPHALGPGPIDPNLLAQGVAPDSRAETDQNTFGPLEGTPLPPPAGASPGVAPSGFSPAAAQKPSVAIARYDQTGTYLGPDGRLYRQTDLSGTTTASRSWTDLVMARA
ncbi:MCE family protein [Mycobacterium sp. DL440]|uniref:MCE family protein n=1 Tax=Mycobacterium sp. DL440 TaxID=2675523 RepID=UPI0014230A45|nr:MlaD family protein [Mycobacterium sp. DL440]